VEVDLDVVTTWVGDAVGRTPRADGPKHHLIPVIDEASVALVRARVREEAGRLGLGEVQAGAIVTAASELAHNQLRHARDGVVVVRETRRAEGIGVEVVAADGGSGIGDVARGLEGAKPSSESLGAGLSAVFRLADEVDVDVRAQEGTCIWARKFQSAPSQRLRVGVYGRPYPGERCSGDDAAFVRYGNDGQELLAGVVDGLGHGEAARQASVSAARLLLERPHVGDVAPDALLLACDERLRGTRGAVMSVGHIDGAGTVTMAGVGNVGACIFGTGATWRFGGSSFFLGAGARAPRIGLERSRMQVRDVLVLFSDGIRSSIDLSRDFDLLREHPIVIAQRVVERYGRADDDVLVMVIG
jgi:anti-sigma regulatory factor (Ser/Thr protein kinase)